MNRRGVHWAGSPEPRMDILLPHGYSCPRQRRRIETRRRGLEGLPSHVSSSGGGGGRRNRRSIRRDGHGEGPGTPDDAPPSNPKSVEQNTRGLSHGASKATHAFPLRGICGDGEAGLTPVSYRGHPQGRQCGRRRETGTSPVSWKSPRRFRVNKLAGIVAPPLVGQPVEGPLCCPKTPGGRIRAGPCPLLGRRSGSRGGSRQ